MKPAAKKADPTPAAPARAVPGAGKPERAAGGERGRGGRYPSRGAPRNVYRNEGDRNTGPTSTEGVAEGMETPGGFDGERVRKLSLIYDSISEAELQPHQRKAITSEMPIPRDQGETDPSRTLQPVDTLRPAAEGARRIRLLRVVRGGNSRGGAEDCRTARRRWTMDGVRMRVRLSLLVS